jgi:hypothetical protein
MPVDERLALHGLEGTLPAVPRLAPAAAALSAAAALAAVALAAGCGESDEDRVREAVRSYGDAVAKKDYQRICDELIARELVQNLEEIGLPCEVALRRGLGSVRRPKLEIRKVQVVKDRALVSVHSTAANQKPSDDMLEVRRQDGEWRVSGLGKPQPQPPARTTP